MPKPIDVPTDLNLFRLRGGTVWGLLALVAFLAWGAAALYHRLEDAEASAARVEATTAKLSEEVSHLRQEMSRKIDRLSDAIGATITKTDARGWQEAGAP